MTVGELIVLLQNHDQDAVVVSIRPGGTHLEPADAPEAVRLRSSDWTPVHTPAAGEGEATFSAVLIG